jgi:hypothetical protein
MAKSNSWRGHDWSSDLPLWDQNHPLFKEVGSAKGAQILTTEYATTEVVVPDLDPELCEVIASFAACFTAPFYKAQRIVPVVALERVARLYWELGNDPQKWLDYLAQIGVKVAPQSRSEFVGFLRFICGNALDRSRRLGKMAWCLSEWVEIFDPEKDNGDGLGWPDPLPYDEVPGTSDFAKWASRGYTKIADARRARLSAAGVAVDDNYSESDSVIAPDPEPPPEASPDGSRNPSPPEPSEDGSEPEPDSNSESNSELPAEADELDGEPILAAVFLRMALDRGCTVSVIGITSGRNEPRSDQVSPNDARAQGWMLLARCPNSDEDGIYAEVIWRDRAVIEDFIQQHTRHAPEHPRQGSEAEPRASAKGGSSSAATAPPKPDRQTQQTLPDWRKDPEEYGVALLHADSHKAMEVADAIFTAFFMITGATENPAKAV